MLNSDQHVPEDQPTGKFCEVGEFLVLVGREGGGEGEEGMLHISMIVHIIFIWLFCIQLYRYQMPRLL